MAALRSARWSIAAAAVFGTAAAAWVIAGPLLPGGRWLAVHLLTLGVITNLLCGLMPFFARTLLHAGGDPPAPLARFVLLNGGVGLVLAGVVSSAAWATATGATAVSAAVLLVWLELRRARRAALPSRFAFVVRTYERACGAFVHGALLGALLGIGVLPGPWHAAVRLAHLHVNLFGWVGLPLLATLVTFGPAVLRTRMADDAATRAARGLRAGAAGLTVAVLALIATGLPGAAGQAMRLAAAAALAVYAWGAAEVCLPVLRRWRARVASAAATMLSAVCVWLLVTVTADAIIVATGRVGLLDLLGPVVLVGVLAQAVLGALLRLLPMAATSAEARGGLRAALDDAPQVVAVALNVGVAAVTLAGVDARTTRVLPPGFTGVLWAVLAAFLLLQVASLAWAWLGAEDPARA